MPTAAPPPEPPRLRLLGEPALWAGGRWQPLAADRAHGLLLLLACRRDWVPRDELADLLFPGRGLDAARSNLRKVLHLARKVGGAGEIEQRGDLLRWSPDSDLQRFESACQARRHAEALSQYGGELLRGLDAAWPGAARDWLDAERRRLQSRWQEACSQRLAELADDPVALRDLAEQLLRHDPLDDQALQALARAQQALGRSTEALAAVADYTRRVGAELQLEPSSAVRRLAEDLRSATPVAAPAPDVDLIGRRHEQLLVDERLADPGCRVLTLLGPPGVGKSALAQGVARRLAARGTSVGWVTLETLTGADEVPAAVAGRLGLTLDARQAPWPALASALGPLLAARALMLVLDNAETLALAEPLSALLAACPGLRVLATSRAPLGLAGEWRLPIEGLPLPDADERDAEVLRANDAVALFDRRVRRLRPDFQLAAEAEDVVRLVHAVEGLPLALEILAAWRRLMPVRDIVAELAASSDLLEPTAPGERSVVAAFERSWRQLAPAEQQALSQLAALPSPCDRELARQVVQAPLPVLASLVDRSLLRADERGLFTLHPLVRRCAAPRAGDLAALQKRHARHIGARLARRGADAAQLVDHGLAAWDWAVQSADGQVVGQLAPTLAWHLERQARWRDGLHRGAEAERVLCAALARGQHRSGSVHDTVRGIAGALSLQLSLRYCAGDLDGSLDTGRRAMAFAAEWALPTLELDAATWACSVHWQRGAYGDAERHTRHALALATELGLASRRNAALGRLALLAKTRGHFDEALAAYRELLADLRATGRLGDNLYLPNNLGSLLRLMGRHDEALALLDEALTLARAEGASADEPFLLANIGLVHERTGRLDAAAGLALEAVASARQHGEPMIEIAALLLRARVAARQGQPGAMADVQAALAIASRLASPSLLAEGLAGAGVVLAASGRVAQGVGLVRWALAQPSLAAADGEEVRQHLAALGLAGEAGDTLDPATPAAQLLARLPAA